MRVYLDNCCYNRPFDDQSQVKVQVETISKLAVQMLMATGYVEYAWSSTLDYEISFNPYPKRRKVIMWWRAKAAEYVGIQESATRRAEVLEGLGLKPKDALHLASAEAAGCDWFLTTDRGIINKATGRVKVRVANPVDFIMEVGDHGNDRQ